MGIDDCKIINFPKFLDGRGDLSFAENNKQIPFTIRRTYWSSTIYGRIMNLLSLEKIRIDNEYTIFKFKRCNGSAWRRNK